MLSANPTARLSDTFSLQAVGAGLLASFVGFASTFTLIVKALMAVGATQAQAASGLMVLSIAMGLAGIALSLRTRMPVSVAWSTPGAALLIGCGVVNGGFPAAVGAFILSGILLTLAGLWKPLGRMVAAIPASIANAMLAGIILELCVAPVRAVAQLPALALPVVVIWAIMLRVKRVLAIPVAAIATLVAIAMATKIAPLQFADVWPHAVFVMPRFDWQASISIAIPLFLVTMASQNIPGIAVLNVNGYRPAPGPIFTSTGIGTLLVAPFGGYALSLAAITAALCAGDEAGPDLSRRYWAGIVCGAAYVFYGLAASAAAAFISASPPILIEAVAGLALLNALGSAMLNAVSNKDHREAAIITFLVTASGHAFFGLGGAFWGLLAGGAMLMLSRWRVAKAA